jgi:hypothetical protein
MLVEVDAERMSLFESKFLSIVQRQEQGAGFGCAALFGHCGGLPGIKPASESTQYQGLFARLDFKLFGLETSDLTDWVDLVQPFKHWHFPVSIQCLGFRPIQPSIE